jgi:hypothetical protein
MLETIGGKLLFPTAQPEKRPNTLLKAGLMIITHYYLRIDIE